MFLGDNRNISCLHDSGTYCSLVTRMLSHLWSHLWSHACDISPGWAIALAKTFAYLSLQILQHATKFLRWLNCETSKGHVTYDNVLRDMSYSLARPSHIPINANLQLCRNWVAMLSVKPWLRVLLFTCSGDATRLKCPVLRNPEVAIRCEQNSATEILGQSACTVRRIGPKKFPEECATAMQCVALQMQKTGCTLRHYWRQAKTSLEKFNQINVLRSCFLRSQSKLFENMSVGTRATFSFYYSGENFYHVLSSPVAISSEKSQA